MAVKELVINGERHKVEGNIKAFTIKNDTDWGTVQKAIDYYREGKIPVLRYKIMVFNNCAFVEDDRVHFSLKADFAYTDDGVDYLEVHDIEIPLSDYQVDVDEGTTIGDYAHIYTIGGSGGGGQDTISDLETIRNGASAGATAIQPNDNVSSLNNDAGYQNSTQVGAAIQSAISQLPTPPTVNNGTLTINQNGTSAGTFTANQSGNSTINLTDTTYNAGEGISITNGVISNTGILNDTTGTTTTVIKIRAGTQSAYDNLGSYDSDTLYIIQ